MLTLTGCNNGKLRRRRNLWAGWSTNAWYLLYLVDKNDAGLYRDDGLNVVMNKKGQSRDKVRKEIVQSFKPIDLQIKIVTVLPSVEFLDVTLNMKDRAFRPYKKPNDSLLHINTSFNHPPRVLKQLPKSITERLSNNSSKRNSVQLVKNLLRRSFETKWLLKHQVEILITYRTKRKEKSS